MDGVLDLAVRLRQRYPDALFVILDVRYPAHVQWARAGTAKIFGTLEDYTKSRESEEGRPYKFGTRDFFRSLRHEKWAFRWGVFKEREDTLRKMRVDLRPAVKGRGLPYFDDVGKTLFRYHDLYSDDYDGLTASGHLHLYNAIKNAVTDHVNSSLYRRNPRLGTWGQGDNCVSWYTSGNLQGLRYKQSGLQVERFGSSEGPLYALSTTGHYGLGWIAVENRFNSPRNLCISYMASGPVSIYPTTEILLECEGRRPETFFITPLASRSYHVILTTKLTTIYPGECKISWKATEMSDEPFRLTAVKILPRSADERGVLGPKKIRNLWK
eukprot:CAMPEP_0185741436 /NCGR_PEP_ID=MMETSP1171-20130828/38959_1 /TAXON_ID=374046 /ORGANISM="Helicotheca tamensis, Strain CCMP826" /LENGTH=325 /DNA_ID=CAMNT_0028413405 /DNA_START=1 /DNA_END=978 /DNA_ORIENTATION=+